MHIVFIIRGQRRHVDEILKWLETRCLPQKIHMKSGKTKTIGIDGGLRYGFFGTYEFVFPEEIKDIVLSTFIKEGAPSMSKPYHKRMNTGIHWLRLAMKLKKIPEFKREKGFFLPEWAVENVHVIPIGVKYDEMGHFDYGSHEAL